MTMGLKEPNPETAAAVRGQWESILERYEERKTVDEIVTLVGDWCQEIGEYDSGDIAMAYDVGWLRGVADAHNLDIRELLKESGVELEG
jgi:hypothetical protein